jgi:N-acetylglucosamine-6-phosphate deacetylase
VPIAFTNATAITPFRVARQSCIVVEGTRITQFGSLDSVQVPANTQVHDLRGKYVVPGFIDLHLHGGGGCAFNSPEEGSFDRLLDYFISHGTTRLLATIHADEKSRFLSAIGDVAEFCRKGSRHGVLHGIHLEGPFLNREMRGALDDAHLWDATVDNELLLERVGRGFIKLMTMAPEIPGARDVMQVAAQAGIVLAVAHSKARYEDLDPAIDQGLSQVTHIFNAMPTMHHRNPGVLTAAFLRRELKVHLIADGVHVHPAVVTLLYKVKGASGIILISDAISASGCDDGTYSLSSRDVTVRHGRAYLADGTLAGSTVTLDRSVKFLVENTDIPIQDAVRMATLNPARTLGLDRTKGVIAVGRDADLVVLDKDLEVEMVLVDGERM